MTESARRVHDEAAFSAAFVIGLEGSPTAEDRRVVVQRLRRAIRPWDSVVVLGPASVGVVCTTLTNVREVDAVATRLADVVRAPMAVGDEIRSFGVCVGSALVEPGEEAPVAVARAGEAMRHMRAARSGLLAPELPGPRRPGPVTLPG